MTVVRKTFVDSTKKKTWKHLLLFLFSTLLSLWFSWHSYRTKYYYVDIWQLWKDFDKIFKELTKQCCRFHSIFISGNERTLRFGAQTHNKHHNEHELLHHFRINWTYFHYFKWILIAIFSSNFLVTGWHHTSNAQAQCANFLEYHSIVLNKVAMESPWRFLWSGRS